MHLPSPRWFSVHCSRCTMAWTGCHLREVCAACSGTGQVVGLTTQWDGNQTDEKMKDTAWDHAVMGPPYLHGSFA